MSLSPYFAVVLVAASLSLIACNRTANSTSDTANPNDQTNTNAESMPPIPATTTSTPTIQDSTKPSATSAPQVQNAQSSGYPVQNLMNNQNSTNSAPQK